MGSQVSVDKHVTALEDLIGVSTTQYSKVKPEFEKISPTESTHLRIWRFYENQTELIKTQALNLMTFEFRFKASDCYIVLVLSKGKLEEFVTDFLDQMECFMMAAGDGYLLYICNGKRSAGIVRA